MTKPKIADTAAPGRLGYYDFGATPYFACRADQRFSYTLFVPEDYDQHGTERLDLVVLVHGTARTAEAYRNGFADLARSQRAIVLAPLFAAGITAPGELSSYKFLRSGGIAYDEVLIAMVGEVAARYRLRTERFALHGFSGGGHFAHRFLYAHPERLLGVSVGAPGIVTLLDFEHDYWVGVRDFEAVFGRPLDLDAVRRVPVHMVIGADDTETWEIRLTPQDELWMEGAKRLADVDRQQRMVALMASLRAHGIRVEQDIVACAGHDGRLMLPCVQAWLRRILGSGRQEESS